MSVCVCVFVDVQGRVPIIIEGSLSNAPIRAWPEGQFACNSTGYLQTPSASYSKVVADHKISKVLPACTSVEADFRRWQQCAGTPLLCSKCVLLGQSPPALVLWASKAARIRFLLQDAVQDLRSLHLQHRRSGAQAPAQTQALPRQASRAYACKWLALAQILHVSGQPC